MKEVLLKWMEYVAENKIQFTLEIQNGVVRTYDDSCGQRSSYLEFYGYGGPDKERFPALFKVKRSLSFVNKEDEGKEGATLLVINVKQAEKISIAEDYARFNEIEIFLKGKVNLDNGL